MESGGGLSEVTSLVQSGSGGEASAGWKKKVETKLLF